MPRLRRSADVGEGAAGPRLHTALAWSRPAGWASASILVGVRFLELEYRALAEKIGAELVIEIDAVSPQPFQHHGSVLDLLAHVVEQEFLQRRDVAIVCTLAIPIGRFQFLDERGDRLMERDRLLAESLARCMQSFA